MDFTNFEIEQNKIEKLIAKLETDEKSPICDGPVDPLIYCQDNGLKILWLLKEAYDNDGDGAGGWSLAKLLGDPLVYEKFLKSSKSKNTWYPVIYSSFGILNNFIKYDDMEFIDKDQSMVSILRKIAFININKLAGKSTSNDIDLERIFSQNKEILKMQIELYNPDIVIGGNSLKYYMGILNLNGVSPVTTNYGTKYYLEKNRVYINSYHPGRIGIKRDHYVNEEYIDDIIEIVENALPFLKRNIT